MPSFKPFASVTGRNSYSLFDIRLDQDFIVFRGNDHESSGQLLKGVVVLCISSPLRIEDVHLRLVGTLRFSSTSPGVSSQRVDKSTTILDHRWQPFVGTHGKSMSLAAGNYEYPFEFMLPGDTAESVEGIPEASIAYRLKATVGRGKLAYDLHAYKHLRIIRTLDPGALEFLHAMSVENIWPNKVDYSIVIPQKAVVFGGTINMELRFTPLLKGLELGAVTVKMIEVRDCWLPTSTGLGAREHRTEREVATWRFEVNREEHWHDMIEDTGQEGWALVKQLPLPKRLRQCIQDLNHHGIKVRHKIRLTVALKNPDGHISELRATLPVSIFISPNIPFDEQGNLLSQNQGGSAPTTENVLSAPPGYGEHVLDQLYEDVDISGFHSPAVQSGVSSPFYAQSRSGSAENLASLAHHPPPIAPAALSSMLVDVSLNASQRNRSCTSIHSHPPSGRTSPTPGHHGSAPRSEPPSQNLTRSNSEEDRSCRKSTEHVEMDPAEFAELNRVPSYATAVRTPAWPRTQPAAGLVPDYETALHAPRTPPATDSGSESLGAILEDRSGEYRAPPSVPSSNRSTAVANPGDS
ncbi:arrestin domain-containing protein [Metarhizium album ARSEF 1941]|uniref:Arrestin domain-containing protein n=1 Tax=Metarhizium album (strain ARSEF 1941) TaxID=1081103 RepID=A0A0B2X895_METAS|nr:arrestin domain-containing protein [Metarhizium album ARSEF 1941]KHO01720.1 arrestin domain-containing protein [Metarhizium album ARSEF 1941]